MAKQLKAAVQGGDYEKCFVGENLGKLFVIEPTEVIAEMTTTQGDARNVVQANIWVLLGKEKSGAFKVHEYPEALVFPVAIKSQLRKEIGSIVVGRLAQGENKKGNPPWLLTEPTPGDMKKAGDFWAQQSLHAADSDEDEDEDEGDDTEDDGEDAF